MDETQSKATFVALSQALTGIAGSLLAPSLDPKNILQTNYNAFVTNAGPYAARLILGRFTSLKEQGFDDREIAARISADSDNGPVAGSIIKLWLLGSWYAPLTQNDQDDPAAVQNNPVVVSSNSYVEGWIWRILQAHPMGYSMMRFGYWANQPPPLSAYLKPPSQS
jgi:hypothetical protein